MRFARFIAVVLLWLGLASCHSISSEIDDEALKKLLGFTHKNPVLLSADPYLMAPQGVDEVAVCGVKVQGRTYQTITYQGTDHASAEGATITHLGSCGTCSSLQDLAVYLSKPDLTTPARRCALLSFNESLGVSCYERLGFSNPCAKTWFYNARNTAKHCKLVCLKSWLVGEPNNLQDGAINRCLACDEANSGQVFKQTAGRTRRNSGIQSAIERDPDDIANLTHDY